MNEMKQSGQSPEKVAGNVDATKAGTTGRGLMRASGGRRSDDPARTLRALAQLLRYPDADLRAVLPALAGYFEADSVCRSDLRTALAALAARLQASEPYEAEAAYVDCFDRGRSASLLLFEHVHGDSRERGQAMVDLLATYERAGLRLAPSQLPDELPVVLEFASTQPPKLARAFLAEFAHLLNALHTALAKRSSPYQVVIAAVLDLAGEPVREVSLPPEEPIDEAWAEPPAFGGCSVQGQASGGAGRLARDGEQALHFLPRRRPDLHGGAASGVKQ